MSDQVQETPPGRSRKRIVLVAVSVAAVLAAATVGVAYAANGGQPGGKDTGVAACETLVTFQDVGSVTRRDVQALGDGFAGSHHDDLRTTGGQFASTLARIKDLPNDGSAVGDAIEQGGRALALWGSLQVACGAHGTDLPTMS